MLRLSLLVIATATSPWAFGQWSVTDLGPSGTISGQALAANGNQQAGILAIQGINRAVIWSRSSQSWLDLSPAGSTESGLSAMTSGAQGGYARFGGVDRACVWAGFAGTAVLLQPLGSTGSSVTAVSGSSQGGYVNFPGYTAAAIWNGTAESYASLSGTSGNAAVLGMAPGQQVGIRYNQACLWSGTEASYVSLNPSGVAQSLASATDGTNQVGTIWAPDKKAVMWHGSAAPYTPLHPAGALWSQALAMYGDIQVGVTDGHACLWRSSAASFVDLHASLTEPYQYTSATGVSVVNGVTYITGYGTKVSDQRTHPLLWRNPPLQTRLSGVVALADVVWNPGYGRTITIKVSQGTAVLGVKTITVGTTAGFALSVPGGGVALATIDGPTQLRRTIQVSLDGNPIDCGVTVLDNGDPDGSGEVDAADIDFAIAHFGETGGLADVDLSGEVDAADIDIVISSFGSTDS